MENHQHGHIEHLLMTADNLNIAIIQSIMWFSFVMSWHCSLMCGPLVCSRIFRDGSQSWLDVLSYNLGRLISYTAIGFSIGALVHKLALNLTEFMPLFGKYFALSLGVLLGIQGVFLIMNLSIYGFMPLPRKHKQSLTKSAWTERASRYFTKIRNILPHTPRSFVFGLATVFLPCMTLTSAMTAAAASGEGYSGAAILAGFCLGTWPVMIVLPLLTTHLDRAIKIRAPSERLLRLTGGILLLVAGTITILRIFH